MKVIINTKNETHFIIEYLGKEIAKISKSKNTLEDVKKLVGEENIIAII